MELIRADTRSEAWSKAVTTILDAEEECQLILDIHRPGAPGHNEHEIVRALDALCGAHPEGDKEPGTVNSVAETIFPAWEFLRHGLPGASRRYLELYPAFRKGPSVWGTYAHRLFSRGPDDGEPGADDSNPLLEMVESMAHERAKSSGTKRAVYELSLHRRVDAKKVANRPCLTHLSFKLYDGTVHLTALYRSHEYGYKALGNLLGLARLQSAVARSVEATPGNLVVHSTRAWVQQSMPRRALGEIAARGIPAAIPIR